MIEEYTLDLSSKDIGEMIEMIRVSHFKMHAQPFAEKIGFTEKTLLSIEEGKSPHGLLALKKIDATFDRVKIEINVKLT